MRARAIDKRRVKIARPAMTIAPSPERLHASNTTKVPMPPER